MKERNEVLGDSSSSSTPFTFFCTHSESVHRGRGRGGGGGLSELSIHNLGGKNMPSICVLGNDLGQATNNVIVLLTFFTHHGA